MCCPCSPQIQSFSSKTSDQGQNFKNEIQVCDHNTHACTHTKAHTPILLEKWQRAVLISEDTGAMPCVMRSLWRCSCPLLGRMWRSSLEYPPERTTLSCSAPLALVPFVCWAWSLNSWHLIIRETCMLSNSAHWETKGSDSWEWLVDPWGGQSPARCLWRLREVSTRSKGDSLPTEGQASSQEPQHSLTFCYQTAFPSSTFLKSSKCTADSRQSWAWRSNAEQACTQSDIWLHKFKDCLKSALTGNRFKENTENPTRLGKWLSCSPWPLYPLDVFFHSYLPPCSFSSLPSFLPFILSPSLPSFFLFFYSPFLPL